jgi:hypothetical protein
MKRTIIAFALSLATSQVFAMDSLSQLEWKNRVLILFGDKGDASVARQVGILTAQKAELAERDMVVLQVSGDVVETIYGKAGPIDAGKLRAEADVADGSFHVVLVGKDGGVKLRSDKVVSDVEMFDLIDRMPMRQGGKG